MGNPFSTTTVIDLKFDIIIINFQLSISRNEVNFWFPITWKIRACRNSLWSDKFQTNRVIVTEQKWIGFIVIVIWIRPRITREQIDAFYFRKFGIKSSPKIWWIQCDEVVISLKIFLHQSCIKFLTVGSVVGELNHPLVSNLIRDRDLKPKIALIIL